jgi:hypothetical protein
VRVCVGRALLAGVTMGWRTDQYLPSDDVIDAVVASSIGPTLDKLRSDLGLGIVDVDLRTLIGDVEADRRPLLIGQQGSGGKRRGECRLRFRRTSVSGRSLFHCQFWMTERVDHSNLDGFIVRGTVRESQQGPAVTTSGITAVHCSNHWLDPS